MVPFDYVIIKPILSDLQDMVVAHVDDETVVVHNKVLNLIGNVYINLIDGMRIGIEHCRVIDVFEVIYVDAENAEEDLWEVRTEINRWIDVVESILSMVYLQEVFNAENSVCIGIKNVVCAYH